MYISNNPELLDRLAAGYALGTLRGGARRRFETLARDNATIRAAALVWQTRWSGLAELQDAVQPPPAVWTRIDNLVQAGKAGAAMQAARTAAAAPAPQGWLGSLLLWRSAALAGVVGTVAVVAMGCARWVEVATRTHAVATGAIAFFMDMKAVYGTRLQPVDRGSDLHLFAFLHKLHGAAGGVACRGLQLRGGTGACGAGRAGGQCQNCSHGGQGAGCCAQGWVACHGGSWLKVVAGRGAKGATGTLTLFVRR